MTNSVGIGLDDFKSFRQILKRHDMNKTLAKFLFYTVAVVLVSWTASLTIAFVSNALPEAHWMVPYFSLVVFDGGMLAWLAVFLYYAEGSGQRVIAIAATLLDMIGVALMVIAEIFLGGQSLVAAPEMLGEYALWAIGIWTTLNVAGVIGFHLLDNDNRQRMAIQAEADEIFETALKLLKQKRVNHGHELADDMAEGMMAQLVDRLTQDANRNGIPDIMERDNAPRQLPRMAASQPNEARGLRDAGEGERPNS